MRRAVVVYREGAGWTFRPSGPAADPTLMVLTAKGWWVEGDEITLESRRGRSWSFTAREFAAAARLGAFRLRVWYDAEKPRGGA